MVRRVLAAHWAATRAACAWSRRDVGGGFGPKAGFYAGRVRGRARPRMQLGRPVKWVEDRREHFLATTQQRDQLWDLEVAADAERPHARRARPLPARQRRLRALRPDRCRDHAAARCPAPMR